MLTGWRQGALTVGTLICGVLLVTTVNGQIVYLEQGGVVVGEGEHFSNRIAGPATDWTVKPTENGGTAIADGGPIISNSRALGYIQTLPDGLNPGGVNVPPEAHYQFNITNPGTYQLYLRWDGNDTNGTTRGQSDSMFADIIELKDGAGGTIADHYEFVQPVNGDFASPAWDGTGGFELNNATGTPAVAATFGITTPGTYTLRFTQREDGNAVDAFVLQDISLPAPTGFGPATSLLASDVEFDSVTAEADTFVQLGNAGTNFGSNDNILVKDSGGGGTTRKGYLRFDVTGQPLTELTNAQLQLEVSVNNNGGTPQDPTPVAYTIDVYGLNDGDAGEGWDEGTITWNNAPANDTADNDILGNATFLGQFGVPALNPDLETDPILVSFNNLMSESDDALLDFLAADTDGQVTFILARDGGSNNLGFFSIEGAAANEALAPTLTLFSTIPEPASVAIWSLIGVLLVGTCLWRRRRA